VTSGRTKVNAVKAIGGLRLRIGSKARLEPGPPHHRGARHGVTRWRPAHDLVAGGNRHGYTTQRHHGRDFTADLVVDIANAREGRPMPAMR
jgi:hypothetical protein